MTAVMDVTLVGAGPYGLSVGAHLAGIPGLDLLILGKPMNSWSQRMPKGMQLKSAGFASNLYARHHRYSLRDFYAEQGQAYDDLRLPVPVEMFCAYGLAFQQRFLPNIKSDHLVAMHADGRDFVLHTDAGEVIHSRRVILAVGQDDFAFVPEVLAGLPKQYVTHSSEHHALDHFSNQDVVVIGGGASATDLAVLLDEAQARVVQVMRRGSAHFSSIWQESSASWLARVRYPVSSIGPGWRNRLYAELPGLYRQLPDRLRLRIVRRHLGPSAGWFMAERAAKVPRLGGYEVEQACITHGRVRLRLRASDGGSREIDADHVIAATGFQANLSRLAFLDASMRARLALVGGAPKLSGNFESSVPGLHFIGPVAAPNFGPVMRFVAGADFTARRMATAFARPRPVDRTRRLTTARG